MSIALLRVLSVLNRVNQDLLRIHKKYMSNSCLFHYPNHEVMKNIKEYYCNDLGCSMHDNFRKRSLRVGLGRYCQQSIRYVFQTDLADTIRFRYDTPSCTNPKVLQSRVLDCNNKVNVFGFIVTVNEKNTSAKAK